MRGQRYDAAPRLGMVITNPAARGWHPAGPAAGVELKNKYCGSSADSDRAMIAAPSAGDPGAPRRQEAHLRESSPTPGIELASLPCSRDEQTLCHRETAAQA